MFYSAQRRLAEQHFYSAHALFHQGRHLEALKEVSSAEALFRGLDARGHPFSIPLSNGISGLANCLALEGRCHQQLGDCRAAVSCYETSLINAKFEKKTPFRSFLLSVSKDLIFCYEKLLEANSPGDREIMTSTVPDPDIAFRFPYSLPPGLIPFARLYELDRGQYGRYRGFYERSRDRDEALRRGSKTADDSIMKRTSFYVWGILTAVWMIYALIAFKLVSR